MAVVTLVLNGQNLMAFAEAVNAEFPGFEMSCEMVWCVVLWIGHRVL